MSRITNNSRLSALSLCIGLAFAGAASLAAAQSASQPAGAGATSGGAMSGGAMSGGAMSNAGKSSGAMAGGAKSAAVPAADKAFAQKAAVGGMAEVEMGKLAQQKAANDQVKQFGSRMVDDHSKANDELKQVASAKGMTLPSDLDAAHKAKMAKMQKLSGAAFDRAYMDEMLADHKKDVSEFQKEASSGKDSDIKGFASKTLPTLQDHLKMAQDTHAAVKGGKSASR